MFRVHLIARSVTSRSLHLLAIRISSYLSLKADSVLKYLAGAKIACSISSITDNEAEELCKAKFEKLGKDAVSYADIARRAWEVGSAGLAGERDLSSIRRCRPVDVSLSKASRLRDARSDQAPLLLPMRAGVVESGGYWGYRTG